MKEKIKPIASSILVMIIISVIVNLMIWEQAKDMTSKLYLNSIDYNVVINKDGSMDVVETWDIKISATNTLFKTFSLSKMKYGDIENVKVKDLDDNTNLLQIQEEMYHVTTGCYYGLEVNSSTFEIAWGTGMEYKSGNKKYQISYTVKDVVTDYNDCQEIYWQFLEQGKNTIPAKKVTGTVTLPETVNNLDNLMVWGHGQLNGIIEKTNAQKVRFELENLNVGKRLEIRIITSEKMFNSNVNKERGYNYLDDALNEEKQWANEANKQQYDVYNMMKKITVLLIIIFFIGVIRLVKAKKIKKKENRNEGLKYYREIPRESATPAEAVYLYNFERERLATGKIQRNTVSATILDLCFKKKVDLKINERKKVAISFNNCDTRDLKKDELKIYKLLKNASKNEKEFEIEKLNIYAKKEYNKYSNYINEFVNEARNNLYKLKLIDKKKEKQYRSYILADIKYEMLKWFYEFFIVYYIISMLPVFKNAAITVFGNTRIVFQNYMLAAILMCLPVVLVFLHLYKVQSKQKNKIAILTEAGEDEKEKWKALKGFMSEYSLISEKGMNDLVIWEKYLIFATAFGLSDKVIKEFKAKYKRVIIEEKWNESDIKEKYPLLYFSYGFDSNNINTNSFFNSISTLNSNVSRAYITSATEIASHHITSSGSGLGGGFSGGGGGRRRSEAGMGGR